MHSHTFIKSSQNIYTQGQLPYELFATRYLSNFNKVKVCARMIESKEIKNLNLSSGPDVYFEKLPNLSTIKSRHIAIKKTKEILKRNILDVDVVVARMPSAHADIAIKLAREMNKPFVVEVVGDVFQSLWNHGSLLGKLIAPYSYIKYKQTISKSNYTIYVTKEVLQKKYPSNKNAYTINASNVEIPKVDSQILKTRLLNEKARNKMSINIGLIGSYATKYKGIQNAIDLIRKLRSLGFKAHLRVLGSGNNEWLILKAKRLNVENYIHFDGLLPAGNEVLNWLDNLDLYIQPSLTEGLPRALIEAMSRALPAVASQVGGIPELLDKEFLHEPGSSNDLIDKVLNLINDRQLIEQQTIRNFNKSKEFTKEILDKKRNEFWDYFIKKELNRK